MIFKYVVVQDKNDLKWFDIIYFTNGIANPYFENHNGNKLIGVGFSVKIEIANGYKLYIDDNSNEMIIYNKDDIETKKSFNNYYLSEIAY